MQVERKEKNSFKCKGFIKNAAATACVVFAVVFLISGGNLSSLAQKGLLMSAAVAQDETQNTEADANQSGNSENADAESTGDANAQSGPSAEMENTADTLEKQPEALLTNISFPTVDGKSWILINYNTGHVLLEKDSSLRIPPASMTKVMTAFIAFDYLRKGLISEEDMVLVSEKAWRTGGSKMFILVNDQVRFIDLLRGLIIQSGNDAAVAIAEKIAGTEESFASLMNQYGEEMGMKNSNFKNASGWPDPEHYTTAEDLAILSIAMIRNFPKYYELYSELDFEYGGIKQNNRNGLLRKDSRVDGIKTGHTEEAGYCLMASSVEDKARYVAVITGSSSVRARENAVYSMLNFGHANYKIADLYDTGNIGRSMRVLEGKADNVELQVKSPVDVLLPNQLHQNDIDVRYNMPNFIKAPVNTTDAVGEMIVEYNGEIIGQFPLYSDTEVETAGWFKRIIDKIRAIFI